MKTLKAQQKEKDEKQQQQSENQHQKQHTTEKNQQKLTLKTTKAQQKDEKQQQTTEKQNKLVTTVPCLKIKLAPPPKPKRTLLNILTGLTKNLPQVEDPVFKVPDVPPLILPENDFTDEKMDQEVLLVDHVDLSDALEVVAQTQEIENDDTKISSNSIQTIIEDLINNVVTISNAKKPKILKPITLKVHNVETGVKLKKLKKPKFKVIRVAATQQHRKIKRSGSGLDLSDYKGKRSRRRKNGRQKKLDKLIIRNISNFGQLTNIPINAQNICSSILDKTIKNLPCFQSKSNNKETGSETATAGSSSPHKPVVIKIRKDQLATIKSCKSDQDKKIERGKLLKKQLEIDMVEGGKIFTPNVLYGKRKAKLEARKALEKTPPKSKKGQVKKPEETEIDSEVVESILDKIMGDTDSNSSIDDVIKPPNNNYEVEENTAKTEPKLVNKANVDELNISETIGKLVQDEVNKELNKSQVDRSSSPR